MENVESVINPDVVKEDRYLAIFRKDGTNFIITAPTGKELSRQLSGIPADDILQIWRGRKKAISTKTLVTFQ